jgi:hypothetical protein
MIVSSAAAMVAFFRAKNDTVRKEGLTVTRPIPFGKYLSNRRDWRLDSRATSRASKKAARTSRRRQLPAEPTMMFPTNQVFPLLSLESLLWKCILKISDFVGFDSYGDTGGAERMNVIKEQQRINQAEVSQCIRPVWNARRGSRVGTGRAGLRVEGVGL